MYVRTYILCGGKVRTFEVFCGYLTVIIAEVVKLGLRHVLLIMQSAGQQVWGLAACSIMCGKESVE